MFLLFSPFSFLFFAIYSFLLFSLFSISSFLSIWLIIELIMLLFIGISYTVFITGVSSLMFYFFIQSLASFSILTFFVCSLPELFSIAVFLKLGIFPFIAWYFSSLYTFPPSILFLASSTQNLPPILLLINCGFAISPIFWSSALLTLILAGCTMFFSYSVRLILICSSMGNGAWLFLGIFSSQVALWTYICIYFSFLWVLFWSLGSITSSSTDPRLSALSFILLISLSGLPPSPLFLGKIAIIFSLVFVCSTNLIILFLLSTLFSTAAYISFCINLWVMNYRSVLFL